MKNNQNKVSKKEDNDNEGSEDQPRGKKGAWNITSVWSYVDDIFL